MRKKIVYFGQNLDKAEFYNLIVNVTDIDSPETVVDEINSFMLANGFMLYHIDEYVIEAAFKHRYLEVAEKFRQLKKQGWSTRI